MKKVIASFFVVWLLVFAALTAYAQPLTVNTSEENENKELRPIPEGVLVYQEDEVPDFEDDRIIIYIVNTEENYNRTYTTGDFPEAAFSNVEKVEIDFDYQPYFKCILTLQTPGNQNVLDAVDSVSQNPLVKTVVPKYIFGYVLYDGGGDNWYYYGNNCIYVSINYSEEVFEKLTIESFPEVELAGVYISSVKKEYGTIKVRLILKEPSGKSIIQGIEDLKNNPLVESSYNNRDALFLYTVVYGDADGDGDVTANDALLVLQCAVGKITIPDCTEHTFLVVNMDGATKREITANDALLVLQIAVGKNHKTEVIVWH